MSILVVAGAAPLASVTQILPVNKPGSLKVSPHLHSSHTVPPHEPTRMLPSVLHLSDTYLLLSSRVHLGKQRRREATLHSTAL